jgi:spore maturation protein SpmA
VPTKIQYLFVAAASIRRCDPLTFVMIRKAVAEAVATQLHMHASVVNFCSRQMISTSVVNLYSQQLFSASLRIRPALEYDMEVWAPLDTCQKRRTEATRRHCHPCIHACV